MKKNLSFFMAPLFLSALLILPGCKKLFDYLQDHPDTAPGYCRIEQFNYSTTASPFSRDTVTFTYNAMGNPISAIRPDPRTGDPNFIFRYDKYDRLTDLIGVYNISDINDSTYGESWNRYTYDRWNRIISDTFYIFPFIENGRPTKDQNGSLIFWTFDYDSENRVIASHESGAVVRNTTYTYDKEGNLVGAAHDHQVNIHRTNKIWMFLDQDYSMNNPLPSTYTYNSFGLPVNIVPPAGNVNTFFAAGLGFESLVYKEADIRYSCK